MNDTLPGCIGYYGKPIRPNQCENCPFKDDCKKYVPKEQLKPVLLKIFEIKQVLRGEKV